VRTAHITPVNISEHYTTLLSSERMNKSAAYLNLDRSSDMTRYQRKQGKRNACRCKFIPNIAQSLLSDPPNGKTVYVYVPIFHLRREAPNFRNVPLLQNSRPWMKRRNSTRPRKI
jgi:hypothetical protein